MFMKHDGSSKETLLHGAYTKMKRVGNISVGNRHCYSNHGDNSHCRLVKAGKFNFIGDYEHRNYLDTFSS